MYRVKFKYIAVLLSVALLCSEVSAQQALTKDQIMNMSIEELSELPLEDLMQAVETLGVSSVDELFALIMNKNVSSASKKEESSFTSPLSTTVITHDELRTYGCTTIEEAFRLIPGMIVQQKTNGIYDVQMRGLNNIPDNNMLLYTESNNTLLMVDGRSLHDFGIGSFSPEHLPISIEDVERIEVVRGGASALYGTNAVNGVVNIITRKPNDAEENVAGSFQMGSQNTFVGEVAFRKAFNDKVAGGLSFNMQHRDRPTDKMRVLTNETLYLEENDKIDYTTALSQSQIESYVADGTLVPVECNDLLDVDQFNYLRSVGTNLANAAVMSRVQAIVQAAMAQGMSQEAAVAYALEQMKGAVTLDQVQNPPIYSLFYTTPIEYRDANKVHTDPQLARKNFGLNGYLTITPTNDVTINLTGGYSQNMTNNSTLIENPYSMNMRIFKGGYFNADAAIKDLHLQVNYAGESGQYCHGRPGFYIFANKIFGTAEYDINIGDKDTWGALGIRPGINYMYVQGKDHKEYFDYGDGEGDVEMPGFLGGTAHLSSVAPALRLDYSKSDFRAILGVRSDKTNIPDKWNTSYQVVLSYKINDMHFVRATYGHAMRSTTLVASCANYKWLRSNGMSAPSTIGFTVNEDANIMYADNFEIGYRMQPNQKLLIDAELFYSKSSDYSGMMARNATVSFDRQASLSAVQAQNSAVVLSTINTEASIQCDNFPYKVSQWGIGLNADWILSSKLIAKFNINAQRTIIDNYYVYDQNTVLSKLIQTSLTSALYTTQSVLSQVNEVSTTDNDLRTQTAKEIFQQMQNEGSIVVTDDKINVGGKDVKDLDLTNETDQEIYSILHPETSDGHKHKATPSVYGMIGLIAKPIHSLNIAAYANFMSKREYLTTYGSSELAPRMTVNLKTGYKPTDNFEIFFNANNLLNNKKQEFVYTDEIGGIYTVGVNFTF